MVVQTWLVRWRWAALCACLLLIGGQLAEAHAMLTDAQPAAGAALAESPQAVTLTFSEPVGADSTIRVIDANFRPIPDLPATTKPAPNMLSVSLPPLAPAVYTVEYDTVSVDGHIIRGAYEFSVAQGGGVFGRLAWQPIIIGVVIGIALRLALRRRAGPS